eukprot:609011-Pyramimonas_sp.AAC.1
MAARGARAAAVDPPEQRGAVPVARSWPVVTPIALAATYSPSAPPPPSTTLLGSGACSGSRGALAPPAPP